MLVYRFFTHTIDKLTLTDQIKRCNVSPPKPLHTQQVSNIAVLSSSVHGHYLHNEATSMCYFAQSFKWRMAYEERSVAKKTTCNCTYTTLPSPPAAQQPQHLVTNMCMYVYICVCVCVCIYIYIYIYIYTHTHTHTYMLYTEWPKKCIHSLLINIFGINLSEISISVWECNIMFSQQMAQALLSLIIKTVTQKMYKLFTHQYLWNKFKWNFYFSVRV